MNIVKKQIEKYFKSRDAEHEPLCKNLLKSPTYIVKKKWSRRENNMLHTFQVGAQYILFERHLYYYSIKDKFVKVIDIEYYEHICKKENIIDEYFEHERKIKIRKLLNG